MQKVLRYTLVGVLVFILVLIRKNEEVLFYDPLIKFFHHTNYRNIKIPEIDFPMFWRSLIFRYSINSLVSLLIIALLFPKKKYVVFSFWLMLVVFIISFPVYYYFISTNFEKGFLIGFFVRRMLIQPFILILLVPALYFMINIKKGN